MSEASGGVTLVGSLDGEPAAPSRASVIEPGSVVGRHVILHELGAGGMGIVYAAYDPQLDRKIALKLLLPDWGGDTGRLRLLREAQALARLSHPNVVAIHDVGTIGEQVWLAMEFVDGRTLTHWLATPRRWPEVLEVLHEAGEGLAAAHAADLLHRDFKPDNVMVGDDGRVRVMDFGLARASSGTPEPSRPTPAPQGSLASSVTRAGALVGTPSYMAPEQFGGGELTAAADQFAFCVTLWEALYGERPFRGDTPMNLVATVLEGKPSPPARPRAAPAWLRRACERGLAVDSTRRWPSMSALLDTLAKGRKRAAARRGLLTAGGLALLGAGWETERHWDLAQRTAACEASGDEVAEAWNAEREQVLRGALVGTGVSYAATTADKAIPLLEHQAMAWREARVEACLDAHVRDRWDAQQLDRSLWCLDERRMELESLVDELIAADAGVVQKAVTAAAGLSSVEPCRDDDVLETLSPPPEEAREALRAVRTAVVRVGNLERAGRYDQGLRLAREALGRAEALGWPPLVVAARSRLGLLLSKSGAHPEAEAELEEAYFEAAKGVAPDVAFETALALTFLVGRSAARPAEGRRWGRLADVALADVADGEQLRRAGLLNSLATIRYVTGAFAEAKALGEHALAIRETALGPEHPDVANSLNNLAGFYNATGDVAEAKALLERALAIRETALGPEHPDVAISLNNLAGVYNTTGNVAEAKALLERALAIRETALGPEHPLAATSLINLAAVYKATGDYAETKVLLERALAINETALGPEHPDVAYSLMGLAEVALAQQRASEALHLAERAVALRDDNELVPELVAEARFLLARALWETGDNGDRDRARARILAEQARDAYRATNESKAANLADVEAWLATHGAQ